MQELPNPDPEARRVGALLNLLLDPFASDVRHPKSRLRRWYEGMVRVVGAVIVIAILVAMVYVSLTRNP